VSELNVKKQFFESNLNRCRSCFYFIRAGRNTRAHTAATITRGLFRCTGTERQRLKFRETKRRRHLLFSTERERRRNTRRRQGRVFPNAPNNLRTAVFIVNVCRVRCAPADTYSLRSRISGDTRCPEYVNYNNNITIIVVVVGPSRCVVPVPVLPPKECCPLNVCLNLTATRRGRRSVF
jgi:hypothetical protein